jgi:peroxiredoxin Q/BCP
LRDRYKEFQDRNVTVLAIAPDTLESAKTYFEINDLPYTCLPDPNRQVFRLYDVKSAMVSLGQRPGQFVIDKEGVIAYAHLGFQQWEIPTIDETLEQIDELEAGQG